MSQCSGVSSSIIGGLSFFPSISGPSGPFSPTDLPNLVLWLDATDPANTGVQPANGTPLASWVDKSPEGYTAIQATGARQPIFTTNVRNGLPCVVFSAGSSQNMSFSFECSAQSTIFVALSQISNSANVFFMEQSVDAFANPGFWVFGGASTAVRNNSGSLTASAASAWIGTAFTYIDNKYDGLNLTTFLKGTQIATTSGVLANAAITSNLYICSRAGITIFSSCSIGEIIIYNEALSSSNVASVRAYLASKWAIS